MPYPETDPESEPEEKLRERGTRVIQYTMKITSIDGQPIETTCWPKELNDSNDDTATEDETTGVEDS